MFLGYYKAINAGEGDADVLCVLSRTSLTVADKSFGILNQVLTKDEFGQYPAEGTRLLAMAQAQNLFSVDAAIDPDIAIMSRTLISQIRDYKINNPLNKSALAISIKRYGPDFMFYLDWEDRYASITEVDPTLIGKTYMEYKTTEDKTKIITLGTFEQTVG